MDYHKFFLLMIGAVVIANLATLAFMWAARFMRDHEAKRLRPDEAPFLVLVALMVPPLLVALSGLLLTTGQ